MLLFVTVLWRDGISKHMFLANLTIEIFVIGLVFVSEAHVRFI